MYICSMKKVLCVVLGLLLCYNLQAEVRLTIDKVNLTLTVTEADSVVAMYPVACGKNLGNKQKSGDMRTPEGTFRVTQIQPSHFWTHDFGDGKGIIKGAYGPWFIRLSCGRGIGIHGTHDPESMGKRATEGCVRLRNEDLQLLKPMVEVGTVVEILPDEK